MEKLEEGIEGSVRPKNTLECREERMYGAWTWAVKKAQEKKLDGAEMRMLG